tara:strand:+ start:131 stop:304 length:174 start_codon:yes stop_codon:yes gene_type:complete
VRDFAAFSTTQLDLQAKFDKRANRISNPVMLNGTMSHQMTLGIPDFCAAKAVVTDRH